MEAKFLVRVSCMTYNHSPYIVDAMNGFTMQETTFPYVCTIVDDASTDGEQDVIKKYLGEYFDLQDNSVARKEETDDYSLTFARHKSNMNCFFAVLYLKYNHYSIKKSKMPYIAEWNDNVKYIAMCEGDDYWIDPLKLQKQVDIMENNSTISYICSRYNILDVKSGTITLAPNFYFDKEENKQKELFSFQRDTPFLRGWITKTPTCLYRNKDYDCDFLKQFKFRRDVHLIYSLLSKGGGMCMSFISSVYRVNPDSTFGGKSAIEQAKQNYMVYEELYQKTNDKVMREMTMNFYLILFKNRVPGFRLPYSGLQLRAILLKWPKSKLQAITKKIF